MKLFHKASTTSLSFFLVSGFILMIVDAATAIDMATAEGGTRTTLSPSKKNNHRLLRRKLQTTAITCDDLPLTIDTNFELDNELDCPGFEGNMFEVRDDLVIDCKGYAIRGNWTGDESLPDGSNVFNIHGRAVIKNCLLDMHHTAVKRSSDTGAGTGTDLIVKNTKVINSAYAIVTNGDDSLNVEVRNCDILYTSHGVEVNTPNGNEVKVENVMLISGNPPQTPYRAPVEGSFGIKVSGTAHTVNITDVITTGHGYGIFINGTIDTVLELSNTISVDITIYGRQKPSNLYFSDSATVTKLNLIDSKFCRGGWYDIRLGGGITEVEVTGAVMCDEVFDNASRSYVYPPDLYRYCTDACPIDEDD